MEECVAPAGRRDNGRFAQRGMGVDWPTALELIQRTMAAAKAHPMQPRVACGAGTDHKTPQDLATPDAILAAREPRSPASVMANQVRRAPVTPGRPRGQGGSVRWRGSNRCES